VRLPTIPPRDPGAGRQAEAERLRRIVQPWTMEGIWTADQLLSFERWRRQFVAVQGAPRNRPFVIDGITWRYERAP
jgi:hypothetical protein